jgi:hypothetical protein
MSKCTDLLHCRRGNFTVLVPLAIELVDAVVAAAGVPQSRRTGAFGVGRRCEPRSAAGDETSERARDIDSLYQRLSARARHAAHQFDLDHDSQIALHRQHWPRNRHEGDACCNPRRSSACILMRPAREGGWKIEEIFG